MRPVLVTAILLLVVLMFISDSEAWSPEGMCKTKYPAIPCKEKVFLPKGWFQMGEKRCVKAFVDKHLTFHEAERECNNYYSRIYAANLVSIHSHDELCQVECAMYRASKIKHHYWIGLERLTGYYGIQFGWTDHTRYDYTYYARGQPDNHLGMDKCVEMNAWRWGLWNDERCYRKRPYVCAVDIKH